jgi:hypothetical protein
MQDFPFAVQLVFDPTEEDSLMKRFCRMRSRNTVARFVFAAVAVCLLVIPNRVNATLIWDWSFGDSEAGTFTTNGTTADATGATGASPFNFTVTNFTVTSSTISSLIGSPYSETQPQQGFLWNGVSATEFYRSSGQFTNGSSFYVSDQSQNQYGFVFFADSNGSSGALDLSENPVVPFSALTLNPVAVPEPATYAMALAGLACVGSVVFRARTGDVQKHRGDPA